MELTPEAAAKQLAALPDYEESVTAKAGGITNMVWGIVAAAIFLAYGTAERWIVPNEAYWVYGVLWIPLVAAGMVVTSALWNAHAVTLHRPTGAHGVKDGLIGTLTFLGVAAAVVLVGWLVGDLTWNMHVLMLVANGAFCGIVASRVGMVCAPARVPGLLAGLAMVVVAVGLGMSGAGEAVSSLIAALTVLTGWIASGFATFRAG